MSTFEFGCILGHFLLWVCRELRWIVPKHNEQHNFTVGPDDDAVSSMLQRFCPPGAAEQMNGRMCEIVFDFAKQNLDSSLDVEGVVRFFHSVGNQFKQGSQTVDL